MPSFRQISTTSPNKAKKSTPAKEEDTATIKNDKELSTGPEISSKTEEAEAFEEPTKEELNAAPGLPESGKVAPSSGEKLGVKMPTQEAEDAADQIIVGLLFVSLWMMLMIATRARQLQGQGQRTDRSRRGQGE
jgi:hypothetical protein